MQHVFDLGPLSESARALLRVASQYHAACVKSRLLSRVRRGLPLTRHARADLFAQHALVRRLRNGRVRLRTSRDAQALWRTIDSALNFAAESIDFPRRGAAPRRWRELWDLLLSVEGTRLLPGRRVAA